MFRLFLSVICFLFIPVFYIGFNIIGCREGLLECYKDWYDHLKSGEHWGLFDEPRDW